MTPASVKDSPRASPAQVSPPAPSPAATSPACAASQFDRPRHGGTSTDVSLAYEGQSRITKDWYIDSVIDPFPPSGLTIGAGGDRSPGPIGGSLRNGPQSAGAYPGPACYGNGNPQPTNTDANVTLAASAPASPEQGDTRRGLARQAARKRRQAVQNSACTRRGRHPEGRPTPTSMRFVDLDQPRYDPRDFALVAFGGAGA